MMLWNPGANTTCPTGCPYYGCCNYNCPHSTMVPSSNVITLTIESMPVESLPAALHIPIEPWLAEQKMVPRRMKRPFPARKEGPKVTHRRPCY